MIYSLKILPKAKIDTDNAYTWYEEQQINLGERFLEALERSYTRVLSNPLVFSKINSRLRQVALKKFPFVVTYEIQGQLILVYSVFHTSRRPIKKFKKQDE